MTLTLLKPDDMPLPMAAGTPPVALMTAMANAKRLEILSILLKQELPVGALAARMGLSPSALSQHLSKLRALDLVETRRDGTSVYYRSHSEPARRMLETLQQVSKGGAA